MTSNTRATIRSPVPPALMTALAAMAFMAGCAPVSIESSDQQALRTVRRIIVLPLTDAPHAKADGTGLSARGEIIEALFHLGGYDLINVSPSEVEAAAERVGYEVRDCYDPLVAAAMGRELKADAVVCGELTHWDTRKEWHSSSLSAASSSKTTTYHCVGVSLRIVRTSDAEIIYSGIGSGRTEDEYPVALKTAVKQAMADLRQFSRARS